MKALIELKKLIEAVGWSFKVNNQTFYKLLPGCDFLALQIENCLLYNFENCVFAYVTLERTDKDGNQHPQIYNFPASTYFLNNLIKAFEGKTPGWASKYKETNLCEPQKNELQKIGSLNTEAIKIIKQALKFTDAKHTNQIFDCVNIENEFIVATTGHVLFKKSFLSDFSLLIPSVACKWLVKRKNVEIWQDNAEIWLISETGKMSFPKISENFPNWRAVVPEKSKMSISVNCKDLQKSIARVRKFAEFDKITLAFDENILTVSGINESNEEQCTEKLIIEGNCTGQISFFAEMLLTCLSVEADTVELNFTGIGLACFVNENICMPAENKTDFLKENQISVKNESNISVNFEKSVAVYFDNWIEPELLENKIDGKINRSNIMKNAWALYRFYAGEFTWSEILKMVWYDAKKEIKLAA